ncbi:MAG: DegV family protein [Clostridia bacterium]|nr:DegV family protein [Clostridia bacterium]
MSTVVFPDYQIFTDAASDLGFSMMEGLPSVTVVPMGVSIGDETHEFGPNGDLSVSRFYAMQRAGRFASTSQPNPEDFKKAFAQALANGYDVLYLGLSSGISGTVNSARLAADEVRDQYPLRRIVCIDTLCASVGQGLLVREAARRQAGGMRFDELVSWVQENKLKVCHWFTVDTFEHLKHGGRVGAVSAAVGGMLNIKPLLHVTEEGTLAVAKKPRGPKQAMRAQLEQMHNGWTPDLGRLVVIGHADNPLGAITLRDLVSKKFPDAEIHVADIGAVIGAHVGPGMLALIYWGNTR